nr:MAG TPA: hypothetical protein [Caudoviricetes sp.]
MDIIIHDVNLVNTFLFSLWTFFIDFISNQCYP